MTTKTASMPTRLSLGRRLIRGPAHVFLRLLGWRLGDPPPPLRRYVLIGAPHTSNWDGFLLFVVTLAAGVKLTVLMKDSLFRWPLGPIVRALGGKPIDRSRSMDMAQQFLDLFASHEDMVIAIAPEGTRKRVSFWKSGFYEIAEQAGVPLVLGYLDYAKREGGFGPVVEPGDDIDADMEIIRTFYATKSPKYPEQAGPIRLRPYVARNRASAKQGLRPAEPEPAEPGDTR
jgi:1-acyl-sn-glycerol-3-phosphate acyltransferase